MCCPLPPVFVSPRIRFAFPLAWINLLKNIVSSHCTKTPIHWSLWMVPVQRLLGPCSFHFVVKPLSKLTFRANKASAPRPCRYHRSDKMVAFSISVKARDLYRRGRPPAEWSGDRAKPKILWEQEGEKKTRLSILPRAHAGSCTFYVFLKQLLQFSCIMHLLGAIALRWNGLSFPRCAFLCVYFRTIFYMFPFFPTARPLSDRSNVRYEADQYETSCRDRWNIFEMFPIHTNGYALASVSVCVCV